MNSLKRLAHRLAIEDVVISTCVSIDRRDWDTYVTCFTPDAQIDYTHRNSVVSPVDFAKRTDAILRKFPVTQHFVMNFIVTIENDVARSQVYVLAQHGRGALDDGPTFIAGAIYTDDFVRTAARWQIRFRRAEVVWVDGNADIADQMKVNDDQ